LGFLLREALEKSNHVIKVMRFASDIDKAAIDYARTGKYTVNALANINSARLTKYFAMKEFGYQIKKEIRDMVVFAHHDVVKDPPFSKMDLICCRNLLIYMNAELQKKIIPVFNYSLNNEGILILGTSESIGEYTDLFGDFDSRNKIFIKKGEITNRKSSNGYNLPFTRQPAILPDVMPVQGMTKKSNSSVLIEKYLLDHYTPSAVVIDKHNDVLYFSGNTGEFLQPPVGDAKLNIPKWKQKLYKVLAIGYRGTASQKKHIKISTNLMAIMIIPLAIIVHSVLSWIFGMTLRPGWHSTIFGPYFVLAAIYSGTGVLIMAMWVYRKMYKLESYIQDKHFIYLGYIMLVLGEGYEYFTFSEYLTDWLCSGEWIN